MKIVFKKGFFGVAQREVYHMEKNEKVSKLCVYKLFQMNLLIRNIRTKKMKAKSEYKRCKEVEYNRKAVG